MTVSRRVPARHTHHARRPLARRREAGQGLVELAMLLPLFLVLIVGVIEVTDALNTHVTVVNAARDGARLGSRGTATDADIKSLVVAETDNLRDPVDAAHDVSVQHLRLNGTAAVRVQVCTTRSLMLSVPIVMPDNYRMCSNTTMRVADGGS